MRLYAHKYNARSPHLHVARGYLSKNTPGTVRVGGMSGLREEGEAEGGGLHRCGDYSARALHTAHAPVSNQKRPFDITNAKAPFMSRNYY